MKNITTHSFTLSCITFLIALLCITFLSITSLAQNTSPLKVVEFRMIPGGIMDELRLEKNQRTDYDDNPVCEIKVKAQGFDEEVMQRFKFSANGPYITKVEFDDKNEWRIYLSSKRRGSLKIKYQGDCVFDLPAALEPKKIYELVLGMETATLNIITTPEDATIYIDNEKVGAGFASKSVSIGAEHKYKVECEDYITEENTITFTQSERKEIEVELRPNFGYITIGSTPSGAEVYVDERKVGVTPYQGKKIKRGQHMVEVRLAGYKSKVEMISVKAGDFNTQLQDVVLEAVKVATGTIVLESNPSGAVITIDGRQYGQTPKTLTEFPVGAYTVYFTKEGYQNLAQSVDLRDGRRETLSVTMSKTTVAQQPAPTGTAAGGNNTQPSGSNGQNKTFTVNGVTFEMVAVKGGTFTMGGTSEQGGDADDNERPAHSVTLSDYCIGKYEVTQELWEAVMGSNPSYFKGSKNPVENVSWDDCQTFISKLNSLTGANFRLPTEAEWEYAARGGNKSKGYKYSGSNNINDVAWYTVNSYEKGSSSPDYGTHAVGTKSPNELGIYDMSGNVYEWCQDRYGSYGSGSQTNPQGPSSGSYRVGRGGCWIISAQSCRVSFRDYGTPDYRDYGLGFRLVVSQTVAQTGGDSSVRLTFEKENKTFTVNGVSFEMVVVKGGTFTMGGTSEQGSDAFGSEKPTHSVTLGDYYIGKFEVTQELWEAVMGSNPSRFKGSKNPVEQVSWDDCQTFIRKLNSLTGANFRLPTEAEWEYAARGGSRSRGYKYSGSNSISDVAWYWENSGDRVLSGEWDADKIINNNCKTHTVGTKSPNELGIYDMSGNVLEWCQDWYGSYGSGSQTNPQGPSSASNRVLRGGSWSNSARYCRVSSRSYGAPGSRDHGLGLRLAL